MTQHPHSLRSSSAVLLTHLCCSYIHSRSVVLCVYAAFNSTISCNAALSLRGVTYLQAGLGKEILPVCVCSLTLRAILDMHSAHSAVQGCCSHCAVQGCSHCAVQGRSMKVRALH